MAGEGSAGSGLGGISIMGSGVFAGVSAKAPSQPTHPPTYLTSNRPTQQPTAAPQVFGETPMADAELIFPAKRVHIKPFQLVQLLVTAVTALVTGALMMLKVGRRGVLRGQRCWPTRFASGASARDRRGVRERPPWPPPPGHRHKPGVDRLRHSITW